MKVIASVGGLMASAISMALGGNTAVRTHKIDGGFPIVGDGVSARVVTDGSDWVGVRRAATDLQADLAKVSGSTKNDSKHRILVGTIGRSPAIDRLVSLGKLDVSRVKGKWEASVTQVVDGDLVIAGADKRGTIYGIYDLSESAGVSPWSWWADVPIRQRTEVYFKGSYVAESPAVKYRGIFINDEAPALSNWVRANYGNYNHRFYEKVFELLLRLRANYLWPAMWNNCFSQDDPLNPVKADEYGIVMGTSHVEPMMRADKEWNRLGYGEREWNYQTHPKELEAFWRDGVKRNKPFENIITMAMRGKIDTPMTETANIALLEKIVAAQRKVLAENVNPDVTQVPQLWCLYKEVQEYYEKGMRVPDDITLLWADDNWGDIRRLPTKEERNRSGGAGVYYHFDYVGGPRNYKWLDTNPISKIWEQMNLAYEYGADRIWIVNVGDIKPMEFPLEFFMTFARNPKAIGRKDLQRYTEQWAAREFLPKHAKEIAAIMTATKRINGRRKAELLAPGTYSVEASHEAEQVSAELLDLLNRAERVEDQLPAEYLSAYFQLVLHPLKAARVVHELYIAAEQNRRLAAVGSPGANAAAQRVKDLFAIDAGITKVYHDLNGGKWNHFMDQTHIGYTGWQQPDTNVMPEVKTVTPSATSTLGIVSSEPLQFDTYGDQVRPVELFSTGLAGVRYDVRSSAPWLQVSRTSGMATVDEVVRVSIDWAKVGPGPVRGQLDIEGAGARFSIPVTASPRSASARGFIEGDGVIAIEAEHTARRSSAAKVGWETIPDYGRTLSALSPFPVNFEPFAPGKGPGLEYEITTFTGPDAAVEFVCSPSLAFHPGRNLRFAYAFDAETPQVVEAAPDYLSPDWSTAVSDSVRKLRRNARLNPGRHTLKIWAIDPGVVMQRIHIDLGGMRPSYLGPPESAHRKE